MATDLDDMLAVTEALLRDRAPRPRPEDRAPNVPVVVHHVPRRPTVAPVRTNAPRQRPTAVIAVLVVAALALPAVAPRVRVEIAGRRVTMFASLPTVADALRASGVVAVDGAMVAAVSRRQLDSRFDRAVVLRNSRRAALSDAVASGDRIDVFNGRSVVEPVVPRSVIVPGASLPAIEYGLWHLPRDGESEQMVGATSGEVVRERDVVAPVAARPVSDRAVALTFDDGPNPTWTPAVLAVLRAAGVKATFCVVGYAAQRYPHLVRQIHDEGHALCDHTMNHVQLLGRQPADVIAEEITAGGDAIEQAAGVRPRFFRAPGGTWASNLVAEVHRQGMRALGWNVDPADFDRPGPDVITARTLAQLRPGAVVLLHDGGGDRGQTVAQLAGLLERLRDLGYAVRVPE